MRRAKTKFRPKGNSGAKSPARTPITSPVISNNRLVKSPSKSPFSSPVLGFGSPSGQNQRPIKCHKSPAAKTNDIPEITQPEIFTGQGVTVEDEDQEATLALVPVPDDDGSGLVNRGFGDISGEIIIPPDANDNTNIEEDLFRFKKPALESYGGARELETKDKQTNKRKRKQAADRESVSTKSSRKIAIEKRKKADQNIEKNTADGGQIDRTEVSMSDLIHCGGQTGTHEMDFTKKLRERREAKERATTLSQLTEKTNGLNADRSETGSVVSATGSGTSDRTDKDKTSTPTVQKIPTVAKPKMRLDENGKIVIDKMSLYQTFQNESTPLISEEIIEDYDEGFDAINSLSFRRRRSGKRSKNWSLEESDRFYEALTIVGNDFQAISTAFSQRSLAEIKRKFMRENKQNSQRIDQLLRVHESGESHWDLSHLKEKDLQYYERLEKEEEEKIQKRNERKQKRDEKRQRYQNNNDPKRAKTSDADLDEMIPLSLKSEENPES